MTRIWPRLTRIGLVTLAAPLLMLQGTRPLVPAGAAGDPADVTAARLGAFVTGQTVAGPGVAAAAERERVSAAARVAQSLRPVGDKSRQGPRPALLVRLTHGLGATSRPGGGKVVGVVPAGSKYYRTPTVAWVLEVSANGRYGRVAIPYTSKHRTGWIKLRGLERSHTPYVVRADLSRHRLTVRKLGRLILRAPMATGAPASPTPPGLYFVTDRVPFNPRGSLGAFAFGISGIQPHLPAGWHGGNQLAIHGTNNPASIGRSVSAGCLRVSRAVLERLKRILILGTPVVIHS